MRRLTVGTILLAVATLASSYYPNACPGSLLPNNQGRCESYNPLFWQGFPLPIFGYLGLFILGLKMRRELDFELRSRRQSKA